MTTIATHPPDPLEGRRSPLAETSPEKLDALQARLSEICIDNGPGADQAREDLLELLRVRRAGVA